MVLTKINLKFCLKTWISLFLLSLVLKNVSIPNTAEARPIPGTQIELFKEQAIPFSSRLKRSPKMRLGNRGIMTPPHGNQNTGLKQVNPGKSQGWGTTSVFEKTKLNSKPADATTQRKKPETSTKPESRSKTHNTDKEGNTRPGLKPANGTKSSNGYFDKQRNNTSGPLEALRNDESKSERIQNLGVSTQPKPSPQPGSLFKTSESYNKVKSKANQVFNHNILTFLKGLGGAIVVSLIAICSSFKKSLCKQRKQKDKRKKRKKRSRQDRSYRKHARRHNFRNVNIKVCPNCRVLHAKADKMQ